MEGQLIVSISREYGSGGREIGVLLAEKLGLPLYDRNILEEVASDYLVEAKKLEKWDEKSRSVLFSRTVRGYNNSPAENVAEMQFALLKQKAADDDSFVVIGRCSDEIFDGIAPVVKIFITGDTEVKVKIIMEIRKMNSSQAKKAMERHDKTRKSYHDYFCKNKWGSPSTYHLCINSSRMSTEDCVDIIYQYIMKFQK